MGRKSSLPDVRAAKCDRVCETARVVVWGIAGKAVTESVTELCDAAVGLRRGVTKSEEVAVGLFKRWRQSVAKSSLILSAAQQVQAGQLKEAVREIYSFYQSDEVFQKIIGFFRATPADVESIVSGLMMSGAGATF